AAGLAAWHGDLLRAEERRVDQACLPRTDGGKGRDEIRGGREDGADDVVGRQAVLRQELLGQLPGRRDHLLRFVGLHGDGPPYRLEFMHLIHPALSFPSCVPGTARWPTATATSSR